MYNYFITGVDENMDMRVAIIDGVGTREEAEEILKELGWTSTTIEEDVE